MASDNHQLKVSTSAVKCKPHERPWRNLAVDRNLDDRWLEHLNNLKTLDLISICEGHLDVKSTSVRRRPSAIFSLKKAYVKPFTIRWYDLKGALAAEIESIWKSEDTTVEIDIQQQIVRYDDEDVGDREEIIFRFFSRRKRDADDFHEWIEKWFLDAISRIERFDRFLERLSCRLFRGCRV